MEDGNVLEENDADDKKEESPPKLGLGFRFDTRYNEQTGHLEAFNLGVEKFRPGPKGYDIETDMYAHFYRRRDYRTKPDDESGWEGQQMNTLHLVEDESINVADLAVGTMIHVVFHFHDNYCDASNAFLDRKEAERFFDQMEDEMWQNVDQSE
uniref:Uncharacterized protein n=1 Tax=Pseudictyota dubia TaxID=2749911 RepID=A0A7R9WCR4_9STRA|mmetsp:Transcript_4317/g.7546  ORF Transcript_4317/g.7546 Transcript_4317/m.7546 type:complete len:153 (+) Transcript_4317:173-631(+)